jgi:hypothetical protein
MEYVLVVEEPVMKLAIGKKYTDEQKQEILDKTSFRTIVQQETGGFSF